MSDQYDLYWMVGDVKAKALVRGGLLDAIMRARAVLADTPTVGTVDIYCEGLWRLTIRA
jgi:hypothetical protein